MRSTRVFRASGCRCQSRNCPRFDPSILRHSGILGAADEAALNNIHKKRKNPKESPFKRKGWLHPAQGNRPGPSGKGSPTPLQQCTHQKGRVTCCSGEVGQALLAGGLISNTSSALNGKGGWMRSSQVCGWDLAKSWMRSTRVFRV